MVLKEQWVNIEITEETKNALSQMTMKTQPCKTYRTAKAVLREVHSDRSLPQTRKFSNNIIYQLKELGKEEQAKHKVNRRKEIKFREEVNTVEIKKKRRNHKTKGWVFFEG